ncbi:MAG: hypothetical protein ACRD08_18695 [Acidimicrobiales bacterium]
MWWSLLLVAGSIIVVLLGAWRVRRYQRDIDAELGRENRNPPPFNPPTFHDRAGPFH